MKAPFLLGLLTAAITAGAAPAAAETVSFFGQGDGNSTVTFAPDDCNGECFDAAFVCTEYGSVEVQLSDFSDDQIADWLKRDGLASQVSAGAARMQLMPQAINMNLMNGSWDVSYQSDAGPDWFADVLRANTITISTIRGDITLPLREGDLANLKLLADACGR